ncbi:MAG TPA: zinc-binding alcohol dehydrogenase family protein [Ktedonosporobacter sp.]|nr:zinc-binding alcohol dehydrogenase family protein [Ktedonosporobacter sp.]
MKAAVVHTFGRPPRFEEFPEPTAGEGEVRVSVRAAGLHPVVKALASGSHYASTHVLPLIPGIDGVGFLDDGTRVYFSMDRPPYGTMAERAVVPRDMCIPIPDSLDAVTAAALFNPALSSWFALTRAEFAPGETVLILGATGAAGKLAVQVAKHLGAGKVIALGRNAQALSELPALGVDVTISLNQSDQDLTAAIANAAGATGIDIIIDYLWGRPTEAVIAAITRQGMMHMAPRVRLIQVGQMAGPTITLPGSVLRGSGLEIFGSGAGTIPTERIREAVTRLMAEAASGKLRVDVEPVPLAEIEAAWDRQSTDNRRIVILP